MRKLKKFWNHFLFWLDHYRKVEVLLSRDGRLYYVPKYCGRGNAHWLSVEKFPVEIAREPEKAFEGGILVNKTNGETYARRRYPFVFWDVKSGERIKVRCDDDLVADYRASDMH